MINFKRVTIILFSASILSCSSVDNVDITNSEASALRSEAFELYKKGWNGLAISTVKQSIEKARVPGMITLDLIEAYDDAGLYYYEIGDYENSVRYQSIAVLLSYSLNNKAKINSVYQTRLSWAFKKHDPTFDFSDITKNPMVLICGKILKINNNRDIKRHFYRSYSNPTKPFRKRLIVKDGWCDTKFD